MSGLRLKVVPDDGPRFLMPVPRATELVADLIKHLHLRTGKNGVQKLGNPEKSSEQFTLFFIVCFVGI